MRLAHPARVLAATLAALLTTAIVPLSAEEIDPYSDAAIREALGKSAVPALYTADHPPATPAAEQLPLVSSLTQYGITWTFREPVRAGQFINGDFYVVGPATVVALDPKPLYGAEIPETELDPMDLERRPADRVRHGFMRNPPAQMKVSYDSGVRNWFDPALIQKLPAALTPGDSLVSTISMPKGLILHAPLRNKIERGVDDSSPIRTAAVLTCVRAPLPPDAFRPGFCDREQKIYFARNLRRELLPRATRPRTTPPVERYIRFTQRPWVGTGFFGFEEPVENMPQYGLEYGRVSGISALLLCTDLPAAAKEPLLVNFVQIGIDLGGMVRNGHPGWTGWGGHGSGRKLPIVFAGLLLGDEALAHINRAFPRASFGEDEQTAYGPSWTGATVVFAGHSGIDAASGAGRDRVRGNNWGPYEHTAPAAWKQDQITSESYRRCCTSVGWAAQALALRLLHAESAWDHDPFFDYVDRWMSEDDAAFVEKIREALNKDFSADFSRQRQAWDAFANDMWAAHRAQLNAPVDGWKQPHDYAYYNTAIARSQASAEPKALEPQPRRPSLQSWFGTAPSIDGVISPGEWSDATPISGVRDWVPEFSPVTDDADLSLKGWVKHDNEQLYFAFEIRDNLLYGLGTERWLPPENARAHDLTHDGFPWFGDEMELLLNASNTWKGDEDAAGDGSSWQMVCNLTKSRLGGIGKGGLLEGEPRISESAWNNYQRWIRDGSQRAAARANPTGHGYVIEWAIRFNPCVAIAPDQFYAPSLGARQVGLNIAVGDLDRPEDGKGNFGLFRHEQWWAGAPHTRTHKNNFGTLTLMGNERKP